MELILDEQQEKDIIGILDRNGFDAPYFSDVLDQVFNAYLLAQYKEENGSFYEAQFWHYTIFEIKKLLFALCDAAKDAQPKSKQS